ncbi:MAG: hypothetical protein IJ587_03100 [Synergistaceae bacterium]|nr:hypothetical protein [Synergistaceae bacterium]
MNYLSPLRRVSQQREGVKGGCFDSYSAKEIILCMPRSKNNSFYNSIKQALSQPQGQSQQAITFTFKDFNDCHDRFWLCPESKRGFCMGTSLNGIGKKIWRADMLEQDEVEMLVNEQKRGRQQ